MIDTIARRVGYRVRPSFVWHYEGGDRNGLVIGFANDGIAGVPGVLRVSVTTDDGRVLAGGGLDPGYPLPGKIRQARFELPRGTDWKGLQAQGGDRSEGRASPRALGVPPGARRGRLPETAPHVRTRIAGASTVSARHVEGHQELDEVPAINSGAHLSGQLSTPNSQLPIPTPFPIPIVRLAGSWELVVGGWELRLTDARSALVYS